MVAVFVMNGQELSVYPREFPGATGADKTVNSQGTLPIILARGLLLRLLQFPDDIFDRPGRNAGGFLYCSPDTPPFIAKGHLSHRRRRPYCRNWRGLEV